MRVGLLCVALVVCGVARADDTFVSAIDAQELVDRGALVLDARKDGYGAGHAAGAVAIDWEKYRDGWGRTGRLSDDDAALSRDLSALGVDDHRAVLVYGDAANGFGEEGRVAWMLRYLGHRDVHVLDGGFVSWRGAVSREASRARPGIFTIHRVPSLRVGTDDVAAAVRDHRATIVDARTVEEWRGARNYLEARGGHLPGARLVPYRTLFDRDGKIVRKLDLPRDRPVYVYCTGGVRSALATLLLRALGYDAKNYDAGLWAWSKTTLPLD